MIDIERRDDCQSAQDAAVKKLQSVLDEAERPLLLLSGGSAVKVAIQLIKNSLGLNRWTVAQVDERYGAVGHERSNWKALQEAGLDQSRFAQVLPILSDGLGIHETSRIYEQQLRQAMSEADVSIALLGMGADGHIAGMLPKAREQFEEQFQSEQLVAYFDGPDFQRITTTQSALNALDSVVVYTCGDEKQAAIRMLDDDVPIHEHPAQLLKYAQNVSIYTTKG